MSGQPTNKEFGVQGGSLVLDVTFRAYSGGPLADDDRYVADGTLPSVTILDPQGAVTVANGIPVRTGVGQYEYTHLIGLSDQLSSAWVIRWTIQIGNHEHVFDELFTVGMPGSAEFDPQVEHRSGFAFNNPNTTSDLHAPGWGMVVTPDEMRYIVLFGTKLVSPDANQTYDNNMLQFYINEAISALERLLNWDIRPRVNLYIPGTADGTQMRARPDRGDTVPAEYATRISAMTAVQKARLVTYEAGYPYRKNTAFNNYMFFRTRRRPVVDVMNLRMTDPLYSELLDVMPYARIDFHVGEVRFAIASLTRIVPLPIFTQGLSPHHYPFNDYPHAFLMDYRSGYEHATDVPEDMREIIRMIAGIMLLNDFGDGKSPALASANASLNSISDSFTTTQSATNALYGARIIQYQKVIDRWLEVNKYKFGVELFGAL